MNEYIVLMELLRKLSTRQSWCPMCGGEYSHKDECLLKEYWDRGVKE